MQKLVVTLVVLTACAWVSSAYAGAGWTSTVTATNTVVSPPVQGGGYPVPPGSTRPEPGTCGPGPYNSNHSESWLAVQPGTENIVGVSKFFFSKYSTFYDFHLGSFTISNGALLATTSCKATTAPPSALRTCRRAGRTTPTRMSTSTRRDAPTRQRCRSTRSGKAACTRTVRSTSPTPTISAATG